MKVTDKYFKEYLNIISNMIILSLKLADSVKHFSGNEEIIGVLNPGEMIIPIEKTNK